jgi:hypothetical protein
MLRDIAVARVKQSLGFKLNLDEEIVQAMIEAQQDLERSSELPFFLRKTFINFLTVGGQRTLPAPTDFIREWDDDQLVALNGLEESPVFKDQEGLLRVRYPSGMKGLPRAYARVNKEYHFYPIPDKRYVLDGTYYAKDVELTTNVENKWLKELPHIIIARAGLTVAGGLRDQAGLATFGALNEIMTEKLYRMTASDDMAGQRPIIGGHED